MDALITIKDQHFYSAEPNELIAFSSSNKCAVIVDKNKLDEFFGLDLTYGSEHINQIIIISDDLNSVMKKLSGKKVFAIAAVNFEEAVRLSVQSAELNNNVVCVLDMEPPKFKETIELVMVYC